MPDDDDVVYFQDIQVTRTTPANASGSGSPAGTVKVAPVKRQRTLDVMFGLQDSGSEQNSKKPRLSSATSSPSSSQSSQVIRPSAHLGPTGIPKLNYIPFSLTAFRDALGDEQRKLLGLEMECMGLSWLKVLSDEIKKPYFLALKRFLWGQGLQGVSDTPVSLKIYPRPQNIYAWSRTPLGRVKAVILGQDPYHGPGQAHGLCFSVPKGVAVPPSLKNIYSELKAEYPEFQIPKHGNLSAWASNGVLMLNTCLTVRAGEAGSHSNKGWEAFTDKVVDTVDKYGGANLPSKSKEDAGSDNSGVGRGIVFLAWGSWAAARVAKLDKNKHLILTSAHPSPHSANRGFHGNGHFKSANDWLEKKYGAEGKIDWCCLDA